MSDMLGRPFMPWQHSAAGLIGETNRTGQLIHPFVVITVPRQAGKTALMAAVMLHRLTMRRQARVWYTAQTGIKAREQAWELMDTVDLSPLRGMFRSKRGAGDTSIELSAFGSRIRAHPPTGDSLHGNQSDLNAIDEGWYFDHDQAHALMGAITPTQATRQNAQTIVISTEGTAASTWFHDLVDRGRDGDPTICLIDYGVGPHVSDDDDQAIAEAHPAIGHTQNISILESARAQLSPGEYMRAYGNRRTTTMERLIPLEIVEMATVTTDLPPGRAAFGLAVSLDRDECVLTACTLDGDGMPWVEVVDVLPGLDAAGARCAQITRKHGGAVLMDGSGPAATVADDTEREHGRAERISSTEFSAAVTDLLDRLRRPIITPGELPGIRLRAHPAFASALDVATLRNSGDRTTLSRRGSLGSVAALESAACAVRNALGSKTVVPPMIWS